MPSEVDRRTPKLDREVIDRTEQVQRDGEAIRLLSGRVPVLVFVNNHFAGYTPTTVEQLSLALAGD